MMYNFSGVVNNKDIFLIFFKTYWLYKKWKQNVY